MAVVAPNVSGQVRAGRSRRFWIVAIVVASVVLALGLAALAFGVVKLVKVGYADASKLRVGQSMILAVLAATIGSVLVILRPIGPDPEATRRLRQRARTLTVLAADVTLLATWLIVALNGVIVVDVIYTA